LDLDLLICRKDAIEWLTDDQWIVFSFYGSFAHHLEHCYFTPGTPKNAEFEVLVAPVAVSGIYGIAPFYRIRDTSENRESLRAALAEFNEKRLLTLAELDANIEDLRQKIKEIILPTLR
jgi:hypothetical protein